MMAEIKYITNCGNLDVKGNCGHPFTFTPEFQEKLLTYYGTILPRLDCQAIQDANLCGANWRKQEGLPLPIVSSKTVQT